MSDNQVYLNNPLLKKANVPVEWTQENILEYQRCMENPLYFIENYIKIVSLDHGLVPFTMFPFQREIVGTVHNNRFTICKLPRQSGKTTTVVSYLLHYILFNPNTSVAILANKAATARDILGRLQLAYENLPKWLQQGVMSWNKGSIDLENGSRVVASSTSSSAVRGGSYNCISGDSNIELRNKKTGEIVHTTVNEFYANSSRNTKYYKYLYEHDRKQIQEVVLFSNADCKDEGCFAGLSEIRKAPYHPNFSRGRKQSKKLGHTDGERTSFSTSSPSKVSVLCGEGQNDTRILENVQGYAGTISSHTDTPTEDFTGTVFSGSQGSQDWEKTFCRNERKDFQREYGENNFGGDEKENLRSELWSFVGSQKNRRVLSGSFQGADWEEEIKRTHRKNQQQSRKDTKNCRETSWNEAYRRFQTEDVRFCKETNPKEWWALEQGYEESEWEVCTARGFKSFRGLKRTLNQSTICLVTETTSITCTPDHEIGIESGFVTAKSLSIGDFIHTQNGFEKIVEKYNDVKQDVFDLLEVEDTHSFYANNILVHNCIVLDEFAFVPNNVAEDFFSSVYPTISSGKSTKVIIVSTPNGMNLFYKLWNDAEHKRNSYVPIEVHWSEVPGRDEKWKEETIKNTSPEQFQREFCCEFLGSVNTLIHPSKIKSMSYRDPIKSNAGLDVYTEPKPDRTYALIADVARGTQNDYSAFIVFDVTEYPYTIVAKYRNNEIKPMLFPTVIHKVAQSYNEAFVLVEVNDIGEQVANTLQFDLEYDNLMMASMRGRAGQVLGGGFSGGRAQLGVRTTKAVKKIGCSNLRTLIDADKLIIQDYDLIKEFSTFVQHGSSYQAEDGSNDDLVMCCVLFSWMTDQAYFKELSDSDIRARLLSEQQSQLDSDLLPFGFFDNGLGESDGYGEMVDEYGTRWSPIVRNYDSNW